MRYAELNDMFLAYGEKLRDGIRSTDFNDSKEIAELEARLAADHNMLMAGLLLVLGAMAKHRIPVGSYSDIEGMDYLLRTILSLDE